MRRGYDPIFLGDMHEVPLPLLVGETARQALNDGEVYDFTHFSIVMNKQTKFAVFSAACVDKSRLLDIRRDNSSWHFDSRIGAQNQVGPEYYADNDYDRGHLTRRRDVCWGERREAEAANHDSFCYANISLQYHNFNTGIWNCLEDWVLDRLSPGKKLIVLTGPIHKEDDEEYCGTHGEPGCHIKVPFGFWKSVLYLDVMQQLACLSFLIRQSPAPLQGSCEYRRLVTYQVPLTTITQETGLQFKSSLYETNPLLFGTGRHTTDCGLQLPEKVEIHQPTDIVTKRTVRYL